MALPKMSQAEQLDYLRKMSPEAAENYERSRRHIEGTAEIEKADDGAKALADSLLVSHRLIKSEDPSERERGNRMRRELELAAMTRENPRAAAEWVRARAA